MLSESEARVLEAISQGRTHPQEIALDLGMKVEAVRASADSLGEQGYIQVLKSVDELFSLTEEGMRYAKEGLPERRLLQDIGTGKPISELKDPGFKIGLGWLKKKGWAVLQGGVLKPIGSAPKGKDEEILEALLQEPTKGSQLEGKALAMLKSRGLVRSSTSKSWSYEITPRGRDALSSHETALNMDMKVVKEMPPLSPDMLKNGAWEEIDNRLRLHLCGETYSSRSYDVTLASERIYPGKKHPYQRLIQRMREIMLEMGFAEIKGEIVQSSFWNFDALFQPQDHPAREMQDTFYLESKAEIPSWHKVKEMHERGGGVGSTGWGGSWSPEVARQEVLRTHTTAMTIKYLADNPTPPVKAFAIDRVYRREAIDATHLPEFEQLEGVVMDRGVTFRHLLGVLKEFYSKMGFSQVRFRPSYYPYTEPSVDAEVNVEGLGWIELGGAGIFRREVTAPFGIEHPVLAWGQGVGRLAMLRLGLKDLRLLYQSDIGWLRDTPLATKVG
jgi:phenylalanyl-tRNA synthetase alpha chain